MTDLSTHVFTLDLTSVCVSTGIVQLPMKMQPFFEDGEIDATVDGEGVRLEFAGPRRLGGFRAHFEKRGLNANDRVRFELKVDDVKAVEVLAACVKRERSKPIAQPQPEAEGENERFVTTATAEDTEGPTATDDRSRGSWSSTGGTVRAVRRVTIVGSDTLPALGSDQVNRTGGAYQAKRRAPAEQVSAKPASWQALDGLSRDDNTEQAADVEFADTTVRAIRRRPNHVVSTSNDVETPVRAFAVAKRLAEEDDPQPDGVLQFDDAFEHSTPVRLSDLVAPSGKQEDVDQRSRLARGRSRIFGGRGPRAEQSTLANETNPVSARTEPAATRSTAPAQIAERELVPVARTLTAASRSAVASPLEAGDGAAAGRSVVRSVRSAPTGPSGFASGEAAADKPSPNGGSHNNATLFHNSPPSTESISRSASVATTPPSGAAALVIDDADFGGEYGAPRREVVSAEESKLEQMVGPDGLEPARSPAGVSSEATSRNDPEQDLNLVTTFLDKPEVPAIVRSDLVADRLGLTAERCERALERLSEGRDRVTRIRKGAYMIRRDATKRATD